MSAPKHDSKNGQILVLFALVISFLMVAAILILFNIVMLYTTASTTIDNSLRLAGISALQDRDPGPVGDAGGYTNWILDRPAVVCTVQKLAYENLDSQAGVFVGGESNIVAITGYNLPTNTCGSLPPGIDGQSLIIETYTPTQGDSISGGPLPQGSCGSGYLQSSITGGPCIPNKPTVVMSLTIKVVQIGDMQWLPGGIVNRIVVVSAGTDQ